MMGEKRERFIVIDEGLDFMVRDRVTGDDLIDADGVADVLNGYENENEQLKHKVNCLQDLLDDYVMVEKENEQLKSKLTDCNEAVWSWSKSYNRVYEENEQLKLELGKLNILYKAKCKTEEQLLEMGKEVEKENEQLKTQLQNISYQRDEFYRGVRENANRVGKLEKENEQLKQQLSDIEGQLVMFDQCDNWDYDRVMYTVRHIAEIMGYNGGI